jgi:FtsP/CotA-like multicopper oxidase with cupredoxin domain
MNDPRVPGRPGFRPLLRDLLVIAALSAVIAAGTGAWSQQISAGGTARYQDSLASPLVVRSMNGVLNATLDVTMADLPVTRANDTSVSTDTLSLRAYTLAATTDTAYRPDDPRFTPRFPGPTFRVKPGDLVQIWLRNKLPPPTSPSDSNHVCMTYPATTAAPADSALPRDVFQDCFHGPNYTNIHYHGMHVTPDSTSTVVGDDVLMVIAPGDSILYSFRVPMNQSPGTHWYHPHKHGSVAIQVANGMAGAFIVEDPHAGLDHFTRRHNLREHLISFQQIDTTLGLFNTNSVVGGVTPLVNGQNVPTIYMAPGEVQRWRIVNENVTRNTKTLEFRFENRPGEEPAVAEVARDGVQFSRVNLASGNDSILLMAAGNRLDVIVQAPARAGTHHFRVRHNPGAGRRTRDPVLPRQTRALRGGEQVGDPNAFLLFRVVVDPARKGSSTGLPPRIRHLASFLGTHVPAPPVFQRRTLPPSRNPAVIVFTDTGTHNQRSPTQFFLGSARNPLQRFNDTVVFVPSNAGGTPMPMILESTQSWKVVNNSVNWINHPFHIHINPFQVDSVHAPAGTRDPFHALYRELRAASRRGSPIWLDVVPLPSPAVDTAGHVILDSAGRPKEPGYVFITQRYDRFEGCRDDRCGPPTGHFVMHCHILGHEERGMMQVLQVVRPGERLSKPRGHGAPRPAARTGGGRGQRQPGAQPGHRH